MDDNFRMISSCACPETELVFECTVDGDGGTYWQGTALEDCPRNRILIRHSQFENGFSVNETCGDNGTVIVRTRTFSAVNNSYTTELIISVNEQLNGSLIECTSDSGRIIGNISIILSPEGKNECIILNGCCPVKFFFKRRINIRLAVLPSLSYIILL